MKQTFENIEFDSECLTNPLHKKNLEIASENLNDFNNRTGQYIKLKYNINEFKFERIKDSPNPNSFDDYCKINLFLTMSNNKNLIKDWVDYQYAEGLKNTFHNRRIISLNEPELFIKVFRDYHPLGFLNSEHKATIKCKLNKYCDIAKDYCKN